MASLNMVLLIGRLTRDPELRFTPNGNPVTDLGFAVDSGWGDKKRTCFIDVTCWGKAAETIAEHCSKGRELLIQGRLEMDSWEQDNQKRTKIRVVCERFQFLGSRGGQQRDSGYQQQKSQIDDNLEQDFNSGGDDIPF